MGHNTGPGHTKKKSNKVKVKHKLCTNCNKPEPEWPMCFRGEVFCSDDCRKALGLGLKNPYEGGSGGI